MPQDMHRDEYLKMFEFENEYWWYRGLHELIEYYVRTFGSNRPLMIFDAGCGTGRMMEILDKYGTVEGMDYSPVAVSLCRQRNLKNAEIGNLNDWDVEEGIYDVLISNDVICTSGVDDDLMVIQKFHRALKPGGYLVMNLPAFGCLRRRHDIAVLIKRRYRKGYLAKDLKKIGFRVIRINYRHPLLFILIIIKKIFFKFSAGNNDAISDLKPLPALLNQSLLVLTRIENRMITRGVPFLFGSSLFVVCQKRGK